MIGPFFFPLLTITIATLKTAAYDSAYDFQFRRYCELGTKIRFHRIMKTKCVYREQQLLLPITTNAEIQLNQ